jgi:hypothetical protein
VWTPGLAAGCVWPSSRTVRNLRQGADPGPGSKRVGSARRRPRQTLKGRRCRSGSGTAACAATFTALPSKPKSGTEPPSGCREVGGSRGVEPAAERIHARMSEDLREAKPKAVPAAPGPSIRACGTACSRGQSPEAGSERPRSTVARNLQGLEDVRHRRALRPIARPKFVGNGRCRITTGGSVRAVTPDIGHPRAGAILRRDEPQERRRMAPRGSHTGTSIRPGRARWLVAYGNVPPSGNAASGLARRRAVPASSTARIRCGASGWLRRARAGSGKPQGRGFLYGRQSPPTAGPPEEPQRRSGIVRRPAAPDSARRGQ